MNRTRAARVIAGALSVGAVLSLAMATLTAASAAINKGAKVTYSKPITVPAPPKGAAGAAGSGDGYDLSFDNGRIFNVFHHQTTLTVDCHVQVDGSQCSGYPAKVQAPGAIDFNTSNGSTTLINPTTHHLFVYVSTAAAITVGGTTYAKDTGGVVEVDVTSTASAGQFVRFIPLTPSGDSPPYDYCATRPGSPPCPQLQMSIAVRVGARFYAVNAQGDTSTSTTKNQLLCVNTSTASACPGQPYDLGLPSFGNPTAVGSRVFVGSGTSNPPTSTTACFDTATSALCGSPWPIAKAGAITPILDANGAPTGLCLQYTDCFDLAGASVTAPAGLKAALTETLSDPVTQFAYPGLSAAVGSRLYLPVNLTLDPTHVSTKLHCYDFATNAGCPVFPTVTPQTVRLVYTVQSDPANPTCLWINSDSGNRIQAIDAYTGGACGASGSRVMVSSVIEAPAGCVPSKWGTLKLTAPSALASASAKFQDSTGTDLATATMALSVDKLSATLDLSTVSPALPLTTPYPSLLLDLKDANGPISFAVDAELSWEGTYDDACILGGQTVTDGSQTFTGSTTTTVFGATTTAATTTSTSTTLATTTTSAGATSTTVAGATTTTTVAGATTTSTTAAGATTTFTTTSTAVVSNTVVLTVPATATTAAPTTSSSSTTTSLPPSTAVPVSVLGVSVRAAAPAAAAEAPAFTGSDDVDLAVLALVLIALAGIVLAAERATRRIEA